jgi:hypothetical protein
MPRGGDSKRENVIKASFSVWNSDMDQYLQDIMLKANIIFVFAQALYNYVVLEVLQSIENVEEIVFNHPPAQLEALILLDIPRYTGLNEIRNLGEDGWKGKLLEVLASEQCHTFCTQQITTLSSQNQNYVATVTHQTLRPAANPKQKIAENDDDYHVRVNAYQLSRVNSYNLKHRILDYICLRVQKIHETILTPYLDPTDNENHVPEFIHDLHHGVRVGDRSYIHTLIQRMVDQKIVNSKVSLSSDFMKRVFKIVRKQIELHVNFTVALHNTPLDSRGTLLTTAEKKAVGYILTKMFVNAIFDYPEVGAHNIQGATNLVAFEFINQVKDGEGAATNSLMELDHSIVEAHYRLLPDFSGADETVLSSLLFRQVGNDDITNVAPFIVNPETLATSSGYGNKKFIQKYHSRYWLYARYLSIKEKEFGFKYLSILPITAEKCR